MPKIVATKIDWIKLGYKLFSENGEQGLNVDKMSRKLKCNKSSFYWHFKTKKAFIDELIQHWVVTDTTKIKAIVTWEDAPKDRLLKLIEIAFKKDANLDFIFYLKKYSLKDKRIQALVEEVDKERIEFVKNLLIEMGYPKKEAELKATVLYKYLIGYHEMIRYKKQPKNYLSQVLIEINQFIKVK